MSPRYFAIVPAAGLSQRMGRPKLLLPLDGQPLIATTLRAWRRSRVERVLVVVRSGDWNLAAAARDAGGEIVVPDVPPPDMKASIQAALRQIEAHHAPTRSDAFFVAPADMPHLASEIVDRLITSHAGVANRILVPSLRGERGHPVLFPWTFSASVFELPENAGLNAVVDQSDPLYIPCDDLVGASEDPFADIDTPGDFARIAPLKPLE